MSRPPKLTVDQKTEVLRRLIAGESVRALSREFGVGVATIARCGDPEQTERIRNVAEQVAAAQTALAALPPSQQYNALSLAAKLRTISDNLASAAEYGAKTAHRLNALANSEVCKIDDAAPLASGESLKGVMVLTKLANDSASIALNLLAGNNKGNLPTGEAPQQLPASVDEFV